MPTEITREQIEQAEGDELNRLVELLCFGDDLTANTENRIWCSLFDVVSAYNCGDGIHVAVVSSDPQLRDVPQRRWANKSVIPYPHPNSPGRCGKIDVWNNHEGQPWQADLEAHVANWRDEPRDFIGDGNAERELKAELLLKGLSRDMYVAYKSPDCWEFAANVGVGNWVRNAPDEATALCRSACLECLEQRKEE